MSAKLLSLQYSEFLQEQSGKRLEKEHTEKLYKSMKLYLQPLRPLRRDDNQATKKRKRKQISIGPVTEKTKENNKKEKKKKKKRKSIVTPSACHIRVRGGRAPDASTLPRNARTPGESPLPRRSHSKRPVEDAERPNNGGEPQFQHPGPLRAAGWLSFPVLASSTPHSGSKHLN